MPHKGTIWPEGVEHDPGYFAARQIDLDLRGTLRISRLSHWGFDIRVITLSHPFKDGNTTDMTKPVVDRPVIVEPHAFIGSCAKLYNCVIREGAVVAFGAVVSSCEVKPGTMVAGNPARVIGRWREDHWEFVEPKWNVLE